MYYHRSGKKRHGLEAVAAELAESLLKIGGTHGIRWAASQARSIRALLTDLPSIVVDLERTVKADLGLAFNLLTPSNNFLTKTFKQKFEGYRNAFKATVRSLKPSEDGVAVSDQFVIAYNDGHTMEMPKAELISKLISDEEDERLMADSRWQLRAKLVDWRFVAFSHFMLDVHDQLAILSKSFQSNSLIVYDISRNINKTLKQLERS